MVTAAQFRTLCLSLPGAEERSHFGKADFRVANRIFAGFSEDPQRGYFKALAELRDELAAAPSGAFTAAQGAWGQHGWTYVALPQVRLPLLRELVTESWRLVAPARWSARSAPAGSVSSEAGSRRTGSRKAGSAGAVGRPRRARKAGA